MAFLNTVLTIFAAGGFELQQPSKWPWEALIMHGMSFVQNYGWRILLFAVFVKVALSPLDIYARYKMRKNAKITVALKDKLEVLKKSCGGDKLLYMQKERKLKSMEGYGMIGACLPMVVTLILSLWIYGSIRSMAAYNNMRQYLDWYNIFDQEEQTQQVDSKYYAEHPDWDATRRAQQAVLDYYNQNKEDDSFLWIKSIWSPDVPWTDAISMPKDFFDGNRITQDGKSIGVEAYEKLKNDYEKVTQLLRDDSSINAHNGLLLLIIFSAGTMALSQFTMQRLQKSSGMMSAATQTDSPFLNGMQSQMKVMIWVMPVMMLVFMAFQPAAFTLYIGVGSATTLILSSTSTLIMKKLEKAQETSKVKNVQKYGRPDPKDLIDNKNVIDTKFDEEE